jgi:hypothetical protein
MEKLWVDFQNSSKKGVRLLCKGTLDEIERNNVVLSNGLKLLLWTEDEDEKGNPDNLVVEAIVEFDEDENCWVAVYEGKTIKHESEFNPRSEI